MSYVLVYWCALLLLLIISGFFSSSETGLMSLNRYRLQHNVRKGDQRATRVHRLLNRPDRLLGVILLGNTFANICASAIATTLADIYFPNFGPGILLSSVLLTLLVLIFAETAPKTFAALYPERISYAYSPALSFLLKLFYPLVWVVNLVSNALLRVFSIKVDRVGADALSLEELKTLVNEASGKISSRYHSILSRVLKLDKITIEHVMIPKKAVFAIDVNTDWDELVSAIISSRFSCIPVYDSHIDNLVGVIRRSLVLEKLVQGKLTGLRDLLKLAFPPDYIPAAAEVSQQLMLFRSNSSKLACVVDEYANFVGVVSFKDLIDEVIGGVVSGVPEFGSQVRETQDGGVVVSGTISLLDLDRVLGSNFTALGSITLNGLLTERLEMIPVSGVGLRVSGYPMEIVAVSNNIVTRVKIYPQLKQ